MATDAERRAAVAANRKRLGAKRGTRSDADKKARVASARTTAGVLFFALPGGAIIRVASGARKALQAVRAMKGAKPIAKPTATQISKAKAPTQAQLTAPKPSGGTTQLTSKPKGNVISGTAREVKPGTSVVPSGGRAVKNPGTGVQRVVRMKDKPKEMKMAQRNDKRVTGSAAKPKKSKALRNALIAGAAITGGYLATRDGDKKSSAASSSSTSLPKSKPSKSTKRKDLGTVKARKVTPQKDAPVKSSGPSTRGSNKRGATKVISAGSGTGFGPKGNIFPGSAAERAAYMKMYGGTGSAAAKAAAAGKQGDMKAGRAALDAAKKKRLSKKKD
tara:strand:- start:647 stop:1642 length:996 start_codon:yes stop_codon:yes gene_type:complete